MVLSIKQVAKRTGKSEQFIRVSLQTGTFPLGTAEKVEGHWVYKFERIR